MTGSIAQYFFSWDWNEWDNEISKDIYKSWESGHRCKKIAFIEFLKKENGGIIPISFWFTDAIM